MKCFLLNEKYLEFRQFRHFALILRLCGQLLLKDNYEIEQFVLYVKSFVQRELQSEPAG